MTNEAIIFVVIMSLLFGGVIFILWKTFRHDTLIWNKKEKEANDWLEAEKKKPKFRVKFKTTSDEMTSLPEEPDIEYFYNRWIKSTSADNAIDCLKAFYKRGYFQDEKCYTYPVCTVIRAWVEEVK